MASKRYFDAAAQEQDGLSSKVASDDSIAVKSKGKDREPKPQTTLFVSSLPFTATSTDLSTLFSDIGPLRRAFVVTDKDTGKSKGVGYVTFAVLEDAQKAEREMHGKSLDGKRKMRIEWAEKKAFGGRKKVKTEGGEDDAEDHIMEDDAVHMHTDAKDFISSSSRAIMMRKPADEKDKDAVRTIIITGLAACQPPADDKTIYKRARKIGDVASVTYPAPLSIISTALSKDVAHILYRTPNHAMTAVEKLHAHTFKGAQISVVLKKRADGVAKLQAHMRPETKEKREKIQKKIEEEREKALIAKQTTTDRSLKGAEVNRGSRLIIRNLPFDVTDRDLRAIFLPYGPIYSIDVPQKLVQAKIQSQEDKTADEEDVKMEEDDDDESADGEEDEDTSVDEESESSEDDSGDESDSSSSSENSALSPADIEVKPKKESAGKGRGFAFVWMVSRNDATKAIQGVNGVTIGRGAAEKAQVKAAKGKAGREAAKKALEETLKAAQPGRPVAVDWALSKKEWELKKDESEAEETDKEDDQKEEEDSDLDPVELDDGGEDEEEKDKPSLPSPSEQTTLFIRNLPYQATEAELRDVFRAFGPLRYAKVTIDKSTNRAKGTGFVCFWQKESAGNALRQAQLVEREVGGTASHTVVGQKNPFSAPSVLTADPSAPLTSSLNLHGRVLSVTLAVEKDKAETLTNKNRSAREKTDRRNTYLMREGVPLPGTTFASIMSEKEKEKRLANFTMRKTQLSKNPSLFVSKTRLSIRQLPLYVSQKMLKKLGIYAVREFDAQVKKGDRVDVSEDDKADSQALMEEMQLSAKSIRDDGEDGELSKKKFKRFVGETSTAVISSKVMLQNDRIDSLTGMGRSRGYGFLEMRSYVDALKAVRFINGEKSFNQLLMKWYESELQGMIKGLQRDVQLDSSDASTAKEEDKEERQSRLKRVEKKLVQVQAGQIDAAEQGDGGRGGSIMVEFSIENILVTKKRKERADHSRGAAASKRKRSDGDDRDGEQSSYSKANGHSSTSGDSKSKRARFDDREGTLREQKRAPRRENWNQKTKVPLSGANRQTASSAEASSAKSAPAHMGSLIGRKRKERKSRK